MTTQAVNPFAALPATGNQSAANPTAVAGQANEQMFLQLLVAQLKNQDPMQPQDGTQFVAQLAQFSELEQVIAIRQNTDAIAKGAQPAQSAPATSPNGN